MNRAKKNLRKIRISFASSADILSWSQGEVKNIETLNYRTHEYVTDGLFDEKIFGCSKAYSCSCRKYIGRENLGRICEVCGVQVLDDYARKNRFGHIKLFSPVVHPWLFRYSPFFLSRLFNFSSLDITRLILRFSYIVSDEGKSHILKKWNILELKSGSLGDVKILLRCVNDEIVPEIRSQKQKLFKEKKDLTFLEADEKLVATIIDPSSSPEFIFHFSISLLKRYLSVSILNGGEAIRELLRTYDIRNEIRGCLRNLFLTNAKKKGHKSFSFSSKYLRRLGILYRFLYSKNGPDSFVMDYLPVAPVNLRPLVEIGGSRILASELNSLYRLIIMRNQRLKRLMEFSAPEFMLNIQRRELQLSVEQLFTGEKKRDFSFQHSGAGKRELGISLSSRIGGKYGIFRRNLLGKRVDYSARSTIIPDPFLRFNSCGIPYEIAKTLWEPYIIRWVKKLGLAITVSDSKAYINAHPKEVRFILNKILSSGTPVLINRAPTLHRPSIQAFFPVITDNKAISIHPLFTKPFNADFDGDQMNVFLPVTEEAIKETRENILGQYNIFDAKNGKLILSITQDIVLGLNFITSIRSSKKVSGIFKTISELKSAFFSEALDFNTPIIVDRCLIDDLDSPLLSPIDNLSYQFSFRYEKEGDDFLKRRENYEKRVVFTTLGRIIFNSIFAPDWLFVNSEEDISAAKDVFWTYPLDDQIFRRFSELFPVGAFYQGFKSDFLTEIIEYHAKKLRQRAKKEGFGRLITFFDCLKNLAFKSALLSNTTISLFQLEKLQFDTSSFLQLYNSKSDQLRKMFIRGMLTSQQVKKLRFEQWTYCRDRIQEEVEKRLSKPENNTNSLVRICLSGARSSVGNVTQLIGTRGLMSGPTGEMIDTPVSSSFFRGLSSHEFIISCHGARKGMADTAIKTSNSGYLTRKLVDSVINVTISSRDCGTDSKGSFVEDLTNGRSDAVIQSWQSRVLGRYSAVDIRTISTDKFIVRRKELIDEETIKEILVHFPSTKGMLIMNIFDCKELIGVCRICYGLDLSSFFPVALGTKVGIIAAQSIGEPGTQLTMRNFHTGGVFENEDITQGLSQIISILDSPESSSSGRPEMMVFPVSGRITSLVRYEVEKVVANIRKNSSLKISFVDFMDMLFLAEKKNIDYFYVVNVSAREENRFWEFCFFSNLYPNFSVGDYVKKSDVISEGNIKMTNIFALLGMRGSLEFLIREIQRIYLIQGVDINDKHFEIVIRAMFGVVKIINPRSSGLVVGEFAERWRVEGWNRLHSDKKISYLNVVTGIKRIPLITESFFSAAAFQRSTSILLNSAFSSTTDHLRGIKENIMTGNLMPNIIRENDEDGKEDK